MPHRVACEEQLVSHYQKTKRWSSIRRDKADLFPHHINVDCVKRFTTFKFLDLHLQGLLLVSSHYSSGEEGPHFVTVLGQNRLAERLLVIFCHFTTESVLEGDKVS